MGKRKKKMTQFWRKKQKKNKSVTIMIFVDGKETDFPVKLKLENESFE